MGRQVQFHALDEDCQALFSFVNRRDVVEVVAQDGPEETLTSVSTPCAEKAVLILWKDSLRTELRRTLVSRPVQPYFRVRTGVGLEFSHSAMTEWNGYQGLMQGRVYANTDRPNELLMQWYDRLARRIRIHWARCPVELGGYVGPNAMRWHSEGGLLLPTFRPPITPEWTAFFSRQISARGRDA
jgi:hypothetical protein